MLFEHSSDSIVQIKFTDLFQKPSSNLKQKKALMHNVDEMQGNVTVMSGNVVGIKILRVCFLKPTGCVSG